MSSGYEIKSNVKDKINSYMNVHKHTYLYVCVLYVFVYVYTYL